MLMRWKEEREELKFVCQRVRELVELREYDACNQLLGTVMGQFPHAPEPHNLYGMLLEQEGNHVAAMKHFRASWDLDPTYLPARYNLEQYSNFFERKRGAYDESDCPAFAEPVRKRELH